MLSSWKQSRFSLIEKLAEGNRVGRSGFIRLNCPFCYERGRGDDTRTSLGWNPEARFAKCFRCGFSISEGGVALRKGSGPATSFRQTSDFNPVYTPNARFVPVACAIRQYLKRRGFTDADIEIADVHYHNGREYGRAVFPHKNESGAWWGYSARLVPEILGENTTLPKVTGPSADKSALYNQVALSDDTSAPLLIVEGVIDSVRYLPDVSGLLSKDNSNLLIHVLETVGLGNPDRPIVIGLDADAHRVAKALTNRLRLRKFNAHYLELPPGEDPWKLPPDYVRNGYKALGLI